MYGLDKSVDISFLTDRVLIQLCLGKHDVILHFDSDVTISVQGAITVFNSQEWLSRDGMESKWLYSLFELLDMRVVESINCGSGEVELVFDRGRKIRLVDNDRHYESYQITAPGIVLVV
jgi:hypothetical protein